MSTDKSETISFKVDPSLMALLSGVENRSEFIRSALLAALNNACPLCNGSGILRPQQRHLWDEFTASHPREECGRCHVHVFTCEGKPLDHACRQRPRRSRARSRA